MIIKLIPKRNWIDDTIVHELPEPDMIIDPRPIIEWFSRIQEESFKCRVTVNGTSLTVTRTGGNKCLRHYPRFRVYGDKEDFCSFQSTKYIYQGLDYETAPEDTTEVIVKDGVERIWGWAFCKCTSLTKVTIPSTVKCIGSHAFGECTSLQYIQLPSSLQYIGKSAFVGCSSLRALYIPPGVACIDRCTFASCASLRIINIPDSVKYIEDRAVHNCYGLLWKEFQDKTSKEELIQWLKNRYNSLHEICWSPFVTKHAIVEYIQSHDDNEEKARTKDRPGFTPLHLLAANPSVTGELITAYLDLSPNVASMQDNLGKTPLHILCSVVPAVDSGLAIAAFLASMQGKMAAFMMDDEGMIPFEYLCRNNYDEMVFLKNKSFAGLMIWWYECIGICFL